MKNNGDRILTAMFCDDIRQEVGNKVSLMGCYQGELTIQNMALPGVAIVLPKLCIYASAWTPKARPFKELILRVVQDDMNEFARLEVPLQQFDNDTQPDDPTATRKTIHAAIAFAPFVIEKPMTLRVIAITEEGEMVGPRLVIKVAQVEPPASVPAAKPKAAKPTRKRATTTTTSGVKKKQ